MDQIYIEIHVEGGCVRDVYSNYDKHQVDVVLVDHDSLAEEGKEAPEVSPQLHMVF